MSAQNRIFWSPRLKKKEKAIRDDGTLELVENTAGTQAVPCRYAFCIRINVGPGVHFVAKKFSQVLGVQFHKTYTPVISPSNVRLIFGFVSFLDLDRDQVNVDVAFLDGNGKEKICMELPAEFCDPGKPNLAYRSLKALYGLKRSSRRWYAKFHDFLAKVLNLENCPYELPLCRLRKKRILLCTILLSEDLLLFSSTWSESLRVETAVSSHVKIEDLPSSIEFLGSQTTRYSSKRSFLYPGLSLSTKFLENFKRNTPGRSTRQWRTQLQFFSPKSRAFV